MKKPCLLTSAFVVSSYFFMPFQAVASSDNMLVVLGGHGMPGNELVKEFS